MEVAQVKLADRPSASLGYKTFLNRKTAELVFAFVEPIGGGAKDAAKILGEILQGAQYKYRINNIEVSSIIENEAELIDLAEPSQEIFIHNGIFSPTERGRDINKLQQWGNNLRGENGFDFLGKQIIRSIAAYRRDNEGFEKVAGASVPSPKALRVAHIVRSLKHEAELDLLKAVYGDMLIVIGITGPYQKRLNNFSPEAKPRDIALLVEKEFDLLTTIDQDEGIKNGQRVRKVFHKATLFLINDESSIKDEIRRFLELLFDICVHSPKIDERMMYEAYSSSLQSTCLSRQVGAAISDLNGELISVGWNDIPKFGGGLATDLQSQDNVALCKTKGFCNTGRKLSELTEKIFKRLSTKNGDDEPVLKKRVTSKKLHGLLLSAGLSELIEFSRAIHAEMEAILSAARNGKQGLRGGTIYVTTYPCENCAKHILATGISKIIYIEPYVKSRAKDFFPEFIADEFDGGQNKLTLHQFVGIAPASFSGLYKMRNERKNDEGNLIQHQGLPMPKTSVFLDSFTVYEQQIAKDVLAHEQE